MNSDNLFAEEFALAAAENAVTEREHGQAVKARAISRKITRIEVRRAKCEAALQEILPSKLEMGTSYHVISHGDVDSLSYLMHIVKNTPLDAVLISTWCMAMPDLEWLREQVETWRVGKIDFVLGEIFPASYPDEYDACKQIEADELGSFRIAKNHAKIILGSHAESGLHFAIESSANLNTNPRIEQTAIHLDKTLHDFYADFFAGIKSIDGAKYKKPKP